MLNYIQESASLGDTASSALVISRPGLLVKIKLTSAFCWYNFDHIESL
jgi:hypothetical protein